MPLNIERHVDDVIVIGGMVKFDKTVYNHYDDAYGGGVGYTVIDQCVIHIHKPGDYVLKWNTTQMTGLSSDGDYFCLKKRIEIPGNPTTYEWVTLNDDKTVEASDSRDEAITLYEADMIYKEWTGDPPAYDYDADGNPIDEHGKKIALLENGKYFLLDANGKKIAVPLLDEWGDPVYDEDGYEIPMALLTVALFNVTDTNVKLSPHNHIKASMMIFNVPPLAREGVVEAQLVVEICDAMDAYEEEQAIVDLEPRLAQLRAMEAWQVGAISSISTLTTDFEKDYIDYFHTEAYTKAESANFPGLWICYNRSGRIFIFWSAGQPKASPGGIVDGKMMFISSADCPPLKLYQGKPCVSPCYCITASGIFWQPLYFDNSGIYFLNVKEGFLHDLKALKFTRTLILG